MHKTDYYCCKTGAQAVKRPVLRQFSPLLVVMVGLPGRGKSHLARRLSRYMNYTGDVTKGKTFPASVKNSLLFICCFFFE